MISHEIKHFNIRVYGLVINDAEEVLLSDEFVLDQKMTKFPGGGLQFGEGPEDCIKREAREEFGQEINILEHFYTTGFFQPALFFEDHQLISIYYRIRLTQPAILRTSEKPFDFPELVNGSQSFRWAKIMLIRTEELTFPIDRHVLKLLKEKFISNSK